MLILEGADHVGKTTLAKRLAEVISNEALFKIIPSITGRPKKCLSEEGLIGHMGLLDADFDYHHDYIQLLHSGKIIWDRFILSELAYGPVFRNGENIKLTPHARRCVARCLNLYGAVTVMVEANWETVKRRLSEFPDDVMKLEDHHRSVAQMFHKIEEEDLDLGRRGIRYFEPVISTSDDNKIDDATIAEIVDLWEKEWALSNTIMALFAQSWGSLHPDLLFIGDRCSGDDWEPFNGKGGSSETFSQILDYAKIPERCIHVVNSRITSGSVNESIPALWERLGRPLLVILGKEAEKICRFLFDDLRTVPHLLFPHPQWIRRFHWYAVPQFGNRLHTEVERVLG